MLSGLAGMERFCNMLFDALTSNRDMQYLVEVCANSFGNPIGMGRSDFIVLYVSADMPKDSVNASPGLLGHYDNPRVLDELEQVRFSSLPLLFRRHVNQYDHIVAPLWHADTVVGYLSACLSNRSFEPGDIEKMAVIQHTVEATLSSEKGLVFLEQDQRARLVQNLIYTDNNDWQAENIYEALGFRKDRPMQFVIVMTNNRYTANAPARHLSGKLSMIIGDGLFFSHDGRLVIFTNYDIMENYEEICSELSEMELIAGASYPFFNIRDCALCYKQAEDAIKNWRFTSGSPVQYYERLSLTHILEDKTGQVGHSHPAADLLKQYDRENGTALYFTLCVYLSNCRKINETADELNIHRNTVLQRLKKIVELLDDYHICADVLFSIYLSSFL